MIGYELEELIGRGGMGIVYRATDTKLQRPVALKLIVPELVGDERFRKRFLDESRRAASLDHASIVPIYESGEEDGQLFLAMRYVDGSDLRTLLRRDGPLALERTLALLGQIASALDAAHRTGLVHRDVKPANILVDDDDHAYLTDFGVSKQLGGVTTDTGRLVGSLDYLAPEQIEGERVDPRSDQYALACVLYECLAGTPAFRRDSEAETLWAHMQVRYAPVPGFERVFKRAFARDPKDRYRSCCELIEAARVRRRVRHRVRWIGAALATLVTAAAAALFLGDHDVEGCRRATSSSRSRATAASGPSRTPPRRRATSPSARARSGCWTAKRTPSRGSIPRRGLSSGSRPARGRPISRPAAGPSGSATEAAARASPSGSRPASRASIRRSLKVTGTVEFSHKPSPYGPSPSEGFPRMAIGAGACGRSAPTTGSTASTRRRPDRRADPRDGWVSTLAAGPEGVWFYWTDNDLMRIDPATNRVAERIPVTATGRASPSGAAPSGSRRRATAGYGGSSQAGRRASGRSTSAGQLYLSATPRGRRGRATTTPARSPGGRAHAP